MSIADVVRAFATRADVGVGPYSTQVGAEEWHLIVYNPKSDPLEIVRVLSGALDIPEIL